MTDEAWRESRNHGLKSAEKMIQHTDENDEATRLADALANLMHWADEHDVDFRLAVNQAQGYYYHEKIARNLREKIKQVENT